MNVLDESVHTCNSLPKPCCALHSSQRLSGALAVDLAVGVGVCAEHHDVQQGTGITHWAAHDTLCRVIFRTLGQKQTHGSLQSILGQQQQQQLY